MSGIFEIIHGNKESEDSQATFSLGIKIKIGQFANPSSITEFLPKDSLKFEIKSIKNELEEILKKLEILDEENLSNGIMGFDDNASPVEMWEVLSAIADNSILNEHFNSLSEIKRRELAEYIFANCNMFAGKGAYFSARYVQETALLSG